MEIILKTLNLLEGNSRLLHSSQVLLQHLLILINKKELLVAV